MLHCQSCNAPITDKNATNCSYCGSIIIKEEKMKINAVVGSLDGELTIKDCISGNKENYLRLGEEIAQRILVSGGEEIINDL